MWSTVLVLYGNMQVVKTNVLRVEIGLGKATANHLGRRCQCRIDLIRIIFAISHSIKLLQRCPVTANQVSLLSHHLTFIVHQLTTISIILRLGWLHGRQIILVPWLDTEWCWKQATSYRPISLICLVLEWWKIEIDVAIGNNLRVMISWKCPILSLLNIHLLAHVLCLHHNIPHLINLLLILHPLIIFLVRLRCHIPRNSSIHMIFSYINTY